MNNTDDKGYKQAAYTGSLRLSLLISPFQDSAQKFSPDQYKKVLGLRVNSFFWRFLGGQTS